MLSREDARAEAMKLIKVFEDNWWMLSSMLDHDPMIILSTEDQLVILEEAVKIVRSRIT